jgi:hypothetical protein
LLISDSFAADRRDWSAIDLAPDTDGVEPDGALSLLRRCHTGFGLRPGRLPQLKMHRRTIDDAGQS